MSPEIALKALAFVVFFIASACISIKDAKTLTITNRSIFVSAITLFPILIALVVLSIDPVASFGGFFLGALLSLGIYLLLAMIAPEQIGGGDLKLSPLIGGMTGFFGGILGALLTVLLTFIIGGIIAMVHLAVSKSGKKHLPFAPIMFTAAWIVLLVGVEWTW